MRDEKLHAVVARSTFANQNVQNTWCSDHLWHLRCRKSARRCGAKHISKSKCSKHQGFGPLLEVRCCFASLHYTTLHYTTLHYTTLHYTTLDSTTLKRQPHNYTTTQLQLHNYTTTLHYTTTTTTTTTTQLHNYTPLH